MRSIPNMTILETGDATEVESICEAADSIDGPVYCRVLRGSVPRLFDTPIKVGEMRELGARSRTFSSSPPASPPRKRLRARGALARAGVSIRHLHLNTHQAVRRRGAARSHCRRRHGVVTLENHVTEGGIGSLVAEIMADHGVGKRLIRLGLKDTYAHGGSRPYLMRHYGLDASALVAASKSYSAATFGITEPTSTPFASMPCIRPPRRKRSDGPIRRALSHLCVEPRRGRCARRRYRPRTDGGDPARRRAARLCRGRNRRPRRELSTDEDDETPSRADFATAPTASATSCRSFSTSSSATPRSRKASRSSASTSARRSPSASPARASASRACASAPTGRRAG